MTSHNNYSSSSNVKSSVGDRVLMIDWKLLSKRLKQRIVLFFRSARHRAAQTEYTPPTWASNFRFGWFRVGLAGIALFVFTQKQIDFTVSVGKAGIGAMSNTEQVNKHVQAVSNTQMSVLPSLTTTKRVHKQWSVDQYDEAAVKKYVDRFRRVAQTEEDKFMIPATAKLAIAIYESEAGTSPVAREYNNHFGQATANGYYASAWSNWRAHSELIKREYGDLKAYSNSVENWISMLARTDYTNDPDYDTKLLAIIDRFDL